MRKSCKVNVNNREFLSLMLHTKDVVSPVRVPVHGESMRVISGDHNEGVVSGRHFQGGRDGFVKPHGFVEGHFCKIVVVRVIDSSSLYLQQYLKVKASEIMKLAFF
jgi:hypothetical protein